MFFAHLRAGFAWIYGLLAYVGETSFNIIRLVLTRVFGFIGKVFKSAGGWLSKKLKQPLYDIWCFILTPFAHALGSAAHTGIQLKKTGELGFKHGVKTCFSALGKLFGGAGTAARFLFNYCAPAVCIIFLITLVDYASSQSYTLSVEYNGSPLGVISNEADYIQAQAAVQDKITYTESDTAVIESPKFSVRMMQQDDSLVDTESLSELMMNSADVGIVNAYGFYKNDSLLGVYNEEEMNKIKNALEMRLAQNYSQDAVTVEFEDKIEITEGRYLENNLTSADLMVNYIGGTVKVEAYYIIEKGDSVSRIAEKLGCAKDELLKENPFLKNGAKAGDIVTYHFEEPNLGVLTTHYETYDRVIERETWYVYDSRVEEYCEILKQGGSSGLENVTALVTEKNGRESERTIVSSYIIEAMVPRIFTAGTKKNASLEGDTSVIDDLGTMVWPIEEGEKCYVSSLYGYRKWDRSNHKGIDIAAPRGTDIYAAASGTVTFAGTYSSYGKLVIIDHGKGYETYYAHQSSIDVEKGDKVEKGDVIGHVGMTGSASGNHVHFEIRRNDKRVNPLLGLGGVGRHNVWE